MNPEVKISAMSSSPEIQAQIALLEYQLVDARARYDRALVNDRDFELRGNSHTQKLKSNYPEVNGVIAFNRRSTLRGQSNPDRFTVYFSKHC